MKRLDSLHAALTCEGFLHDILSTTPKGRLKRPVPTTMQRMLNEVPSVDVFVDGGSAGWLMASSSIIYVYPPFA